MSDYLILKKDDLEHAFKKADLGKTLLDQILKMCKPTKSKNVMYGEISGEDVQHFNKCYTFKLAKMGAYYLPIQNDKDKRFNALLALTQTANQFCELFGVDKQNGYADFINVLCEVSKKHNIESFLYVKDKAVQRHSENLEIQNADLSAVARFAATYADCIGLDANDESFSDFANANILHFVRAANATNDFRTWIEAQIHGLEFTGNVPTPAQLYGENAEKRFVEYKFKQSVKKANATDEEKSNHFKQLIS